MLLKASVLLLSLLSCTLVHCCPTGYTRPWGSSNCGRQGTGGNTTLIQWSLASCPASGEMHVCCLQHDRCYDDPVGDKVSCDTYFKRCIRSAAGNDGTCNQFADLVSPLLDNSAAQSAYNTASGNRHLNGKSLCCETMPPVCSQTGNYTCECSGSGTANTCQLYRLDNIWGSSSWRPVMFAAPRSGLPLWSPCDSSSSQVSPWSINDGPIILEPGAAYRSPNNEYAVVAHYDGYVALYKLGNTGEAETLWSISQGRQRGVADTAARRVLFGHRGNFQVKKELANGAWEILWSSNTSTLGTTRLTMQNDGNLVFYAGTAGSWQPVASTRTGNGQTPMLPGALFYPGSSNLVEGEQTEVSNDNFEVMDGIGKKKAASSNNFVAPIVIVGVVVAVVVVVAIAIVATNRRKGRNPGAQQVPDGKELI